MPPIPAWGFQSTTEADLQRLGIELRVANRDHAIAFGKLRLLLGDDPLALNQQHFLLAKASRRNN